MEINKILKSIQKAAAFDGELSKLENKKVFMPAINKVASEELAKLVKEGNKEQDLKDLRFARTKVAVDDMIKKHALKIDLNTLLRSNVSKGKLIEEIRKATSGIMNKERERIISQLQKKQLNDTLHQISAFRGRMPDKPFQDIIEKTLQVAPDEKEIAYRLGKFNIDDAMLHEALVREGILRPGTAKINQYGSILDMLKNPRQSIGDIRKLTEAGELGSYPAKVMAATAVGVPTLGTLGLFAGDEIANALLPAGALVDENPGRTTRDYALASAIGAGGALGAYQLAQLATKGTIDDDPWKTLALGAGGAGLGALTNAWYRNAGSPLDLVGASKNASLHAINVLVKKAFVAHNPQLSTGRIPFFPAPSTIEHNAVDFSGRGIAAGTEGAVAGTAPTVKPGGLMSRFKGTGKMFSVGRKALGAAMKRHPFLATGAAIGGTFGLTKALEPERQAYL